MQKRSWFIPGDPPSDSGLIGQIFFAVDRQNLDAHDTRVPDDISNYCNRMTQRTRIELRIIGHADQRGSDTYNLRLAERRALEVKGYLDIRVRHERYVSWQALSHGELHAGQGRVGADRMALDGRVDLFCNSVQTLGKAPRIQRISHRFFSNMSATNTFRPNPNPMDPFFDKLKKWIGTGFDRERVIYGEEEKTRRRTISVPAYYSVNAVFIEYEALSSLRSLFVHSRLQPPGGQLA